MISLVSPQQLHRTNKTHTPVTLIFNHSFLLYLNQCLWSFLLLLHRFMGRLFVINLEGKIYSCRYCRTHLALYEDIVSKVPFSSLFLSFFRNYFSGSLRFFYIFSIHSLFIHQLCRNNHFTNSFVLLFLIASWLVNVLVLEFVCTVLFIILVGDNWSHWVVVL